MKILLALMVLMVLGKKVAIIEEDDEFDVVGSKSNLKEEWKKRAYWKKHYKLDHWIGQG